MIDHVINEENFQFFPGLIFRVLIQGIIPHKKTSEIEVLRTKDDASNVLYTIASFFLYSLQVWAGGHKEMSSILADQ